MGEGKDAIILLHFNEGPELRAHWPSSMQNMLVSPIFVNEPLVQIQYLKMKTGLWKWSY